MKCVCVRPPAAERAERDQEEVRKRRTVTKAIKEAEKKVEMERRAEKERRSYRCAACENVDVHAARSVAACFFCACSPPPSSTLFKDAETDEFGLVDCDIKPTTDVTAARAYEDDFM